MVGVCSRSEQMVLRSAFDFHFLDLFYGHDRIRNAGTFGWFVRLGIRCTAPTHRVSHLSMLVVCIVGVGWVHIPLPKSWDTAFTAHNLFYFWCFFVASNLLWTCMPLWLIRESTKSYKSIASAASGAANGRDKSE